MKKRQWYRKLDLAMAKLDAQKEGACYTPYELGDCPPTMKHHLSPKSYKARMDCLDHVKLMSPDLPAPYQGHNWTRRAMAFCRRCPQYWGHTTGSRFKDEINLVVGTLGIHYGGYKRVTAERADQDKISWRCTNKKSNYVDAFADVVQEMSKWIPKSVTHCPV